MAWVITETRKNDKLPELYQCIVDDIEKVISPSYTKSVQTDYDKNSEVIITVIFSYDGHIYTDFPSIFMVVLRSNSTETLWIQVANTEIRMNIVNYDFDKIKKILMRYYDYL